MFEKIRNFLPNTLRQLIKYGLIGVVNALIYFGINFYLVDTFEYFKKHLITASLIAGTISFLNGLYFNRRWTFKSQSHWLRDALYTLSIFAICTFIQNLVYASTILYLKSKDIAIEDEYLVIAQVPGVVTFALLNFGLSKYITFRKKKEVATE